MLKKSSTSAFALALFFTLANSSVIARADIQSSYSLETIKNVTVNANIEDINNFNGEIYFFIKDSKDMKRVFVLNKANNYSSTYELPVGEAKMLSITIYDENRNILNLPYRYDGELSTTEDKSVIFNIYIENSNESEGDSSSTIDKKEEKTFDNSDELLEQDITENKQEIIEPNNDIDISINPKLNKKTIINLVIDGILIIVVGGIALFAKYKGKKEDE